MANECNCCVFTERELYNPGVQFITKQMPYQIKFLNKIARFERVNTLKFQQAVQTRKKVQGTLAADFDPNAAVLTFDFTGFEECIAQCEIMVIGTYQFALTDVTDVSAVVIEPIAGQVLPATIPAATGWSVVSNANGLCSTYCPYSRYESSVLDIQMQRVVDCLKVCRMEDHLSQLGGINDSTSTRADDLESMVNTHTRRLDWTMMNSIPTNLAAPDGVKCTMNGYFWMVDTYGDTTTILDDQSNLAPITPDLWKRYGYELRDKDITFNWIILNTTTLCCMQEQLKANCVTNCNPTQGSEQNVLGFSYGAIHLPGVGNVMFELCEDLPDGVVYGVSTPNLIGLTLASPNGGNILYDRLSTIECSPGVFNETYHSYVGLKLRQPTLTSKLIFQCPTS